jgi:fucose permease
MPAQSNARRRPSQCRAAAGDVRCDPGAPARADTVLLVACLAGMGLGAALLLLPGLAPVGGIVLLGLSAAPMFPLLTLTTKDRVGAAWADRAIGVQSAASAAGSATLPALIGLFIGSFGSQVIAPCLLVLVLINAAVFAWSTSRSRQHPWHDRMTTPGF